MVWKHGISENPRVNLIFIIFPSKIAIYWRYTHVYPIFSLQKSSALQVMLSGMSGQNRLQLVSNVHYSLANAPIFDTSQVSTMFDYSIDYV